VIPPVAADCPVFQASTVSFMGLEGIQLEVSLKAAGATAPLLLYWHDEYSTSGEYAFMAANVAQGITSEGGVIVSFQGTSGGGDCACSGTDIFCMSDLDIALALLTKVGELYPRLEKKQQVTLLQILVKRIIVTTDGALCDYALNSPFVYLRSVAERVFSPSNREGWGSEQIHGGASDSKKPPTDNVERFLSMLRFDSKGKLDELGLELSL